MIEHVSNDELNELKKIVRSTKGGPPRVVYINQKERYVSRSHKIAAIILNFLITIGEKVSLQKIFKKS